MTNSTSHQDDGSTDFRRVNFGTDTFLRSHDYYDFVDGFWKHVFSKLIFVQEDGTKVAPLAVPLVGSMGEVDDQHFKPSFGYDRPLYLMEGYTTDEAKDAGGKATFWQSFSTAGLPRPLFNLKAVREAIADNERLLVVEGEKDVGTAELLGFTATCNPDGAGQRKEDGSHNVNWRAVDSKQLKDAMLVVIPDNDPNGEAHGSAIIKGCAPLAHSVALLHLPGLPDKGDLTDWFEAKMDGCEGDEYKARLQVVREEFAELVSEAPHVALRGDTFEAALARFSALPKSDPLRRMAYDIAAMEASKLTSVDRSDAVRDLADAAGVNVTDVRQHVREAGQTEAPNLTHNEMAVLFVQERETHVVSALGDIWEYDVELGLYMDVTNLYRRAVGLRFTGQTLAKRASDYKGVLECIKENTEDHQFFSGAPSGLATPDGFWCVRDKQVVLEPLEREHRARHATVVSPQSGHPELFLKVLRKSIGDDHAEDQLRQLQQAIGLTVFEMLYKVKLVGFVKGPHDCFKSQLLRLVESLFNPDAITSVPIDKFDDDYSVAMLADSKLNTSSETNSEYPIRSRNFKAISSGDRIHGRPIREKPISIVIKAAIWLAGNAWPISTDQDNSFYSRWSLFRFNVSTPKSEQDPELLRRIIDKELGQFLQWAIDGVKDYLANGLYFSPAHNESMAEWRSKRDSVKAFFTTSEVLEKREEGEPRKPIKKTLAYKLYKEWTLEDGLKPVAKATFHERAVSHGFALGVRDGYEVYLGYVVSDKNPNVDAGGTPHLRSIMR